ncbi:MAG: TRAP transporter small permease subunit [Pseudomonadota bacterium]
MNAIAGTLDRTNRFIGQAVSWLILAMVIVQFGVVVMRYVFGVGDLWAQESIIYMHGTLFMLAAAYTLSEDGHVRVDIFYRAASPRYRALVNFFGSIFLLIPVAITITLSSWGYVENSWRIFERSMESSGIPGVFLLKTAIPMFALLIAAQGVVLALRALMVLLPSRAAGLVGGLLVVVPCGALLTYFTGTKLWVNRGDFADVGERATALAMVLSTVLPLIGIALVVAGVFVAIRGAGDPGDAANPAHDADISHPAA